MQFPVSEADDRAVQEILIFVGVISVVAILGAAIYTGTFDVRTCNVSDHGLSPKSFWDYSWISNNVFVAIAGVYEANTISNVRLVYGLVVIVLKLLLDLDVSLYCTL